LKIKKYLHQTKIPVRKRASSRHDVNRFFKNTPFKIASKERFDCF